MRWLVLLGVLLMAPVARAEPAPLSAYMEQPRQRPDAVVRYGAAPSQRVEVFLPKGEGPHPAVVLLHGGCYQEALQGLAQVSGVARELANNGYAVWNVEYRRLGEAGAAYPGTFEDVADAIDRIREEAQRFHLDTRRVIALGHSAGGHLALWAAARPKIPASSPLHRPDPLRVRAVISVGGIGDLEKQAGVFEKACGAGTFAELLGPRPSYADTSPARLLPTGVPIVLAHGEHDHVMPPKAGRIYAAEVRAADDRVEFLEIPGAGHFDAMIPTTAAWRIVADRVELELRRLR